MNLLKSLQIARRYRRLTHSDDGRRTYNAEVAALEAEAQQDGLAWRMMTEIGNYELTELFRRIKPFYQITASRGGFTLRHYIKAGGGRYAVHGGWFSTIDREAVEAQFVIVKPVKAILKKVGLNGAGQPLDRGAVAC